MTLLCWLTQFQTFLYIIVPLRNNVIRSVFGRQKQEVPLQHDFSWKSTVKLILTVSFFFSVEFNELVPI